MSSSGSSSHESSVGSGLGLILNETLNAAINALSADSDDETVVTSVNSVRKDIEFTDVVYYFISQLPTGVQTAADDIINMIEGFQSGQVKKDEQKNKAGRKIAGLVSAVQSFLFHLTFSWQYLLIVLLKTPVFIDEFATCILKDKQGVAVAEMTSIKPSSTQVASKAASSVALDVQKPPSGKSASNTGTLSAREKVNSEPSFKPSVGSGVGSSASFKVKSKTSFASVASSVRSGQSGFSSDISD